MPSSAELGLGNFKSAEAKAKYLSSYEASLALWPAGYESLDVSTSFGATHVIASGPKEAPPLVLLHGMGTSATMWFPNVADLSREYRVLALDTIGDCGRSVPKKVPRSRREFAQWLSEVLDRLGVDRAHLAGLSYGGFLALNYAVYAPERVESVILLDPAACFVRLRLRFFLRVILLVLRPRQLESLMRWVSTSEAAWSGPFADQLRANMKCCRPQLRVIPSVFNDKELRGVAAPILLLLGEKEPLYDPRAAIERAQRLIPTLEARLIAGASHLVSLDQPEIVNGHILKFLKEKSGQAIVSEGI